MRTKELQLMRTSLFLVLDYKKSEIMQCTLFQAPTEESSSETTKGAVFQSPVLSGHSPSLPPLPHSTLKILQIQRDGPGFEVRCVVWAHPGDKTTLGGASANPSENARKPHD